MGLNLPAASSQIARFHCIEFQLCPLPDFRASFFMIFRLQIAIATWKVVRKPHSSSRALLGQGPVNGLGEITAVLFYIPSRPSASRWALHCHTRCPASLGGPGMPLGCISFGHRDCGESLGLVAMRADGQSGLGHWQLREPGRLH